MIRAIFFDFSGTLERGELDIASCRKSVTSLLHSKGYLVTPDQYNSAIESAMMWRRERSSYGRFEVSSVSLEREMLRILEIPASPTLIMEIEDAEYEHYHWELFPDVRKILEQISKDYRLGIISNSRSDSVRRILKEEALDHFFERVILSKDVGFRKPDCRIFECALTALNVTADEALFVGDSFSKDVQGAKDVGMKTIWLTHQGNDSNPMCDAIATELKEIPQLIAELSSRRSGLKFISLPQPSIQSKQRTASGLL